VEKYHTGNQVGSLIAERTVGSPNRSNLAHTASREPISERDLSNLLVYLSIYLTTCSLKLGTQLSVGDVIVVYHLGEPEVEHLRYENWNNCKPVLDYWKNL
jgi:hypothetical protein